jgi:hypothetical protein
MASSWKVETVWTEDLQRMEGIQRALSRFFALSTLRVSIPSSLRKLYSCTHPAPAQQCRWHVLAAADHHICSNHDLASRQHSASAPGHASSCRMPRFAFVSVLAHISVHRRLVPRIIECHQPPASQTAPMSHVDSSHLNAHTNPDPISQPSSTKRTQANTHPLEHTCFALQEKS